MLVKTCNFCKLEYPATTDYYHKSKTGKSGLSSKCKNCYKAYCKDNKEKLYAKNHRHYEKNIDHLKSSQKEWRENNKAHIKQRTKHYHEENKDRIHEYQNQYRDNNRRLLADKAKEWRDQNRDKVQRYLDANKERRAHNLKNWSLNNKASITKYSQVRRARKAKLESSFSTEQWRECCKQFDYVCAYCGKAKKLVQEHFIALTLGGEYTINNIIPSCSNCNSSKKNKKFFDWYPTFKHYSKMREKKILKYLGYKESDQQLSLLLT